MGSKLTTGVFQVGILVSDIDECLRLFVDALGMEVVFEARNQIQPAYPGFILTEMTAGVRENPELTTRFQGESPLGLLGEVEDIGYCALYLASDAARFVTGQDFVIDGGATC